MKNIRLSLQNPYCGQWQEATGIFLFKTKIFYFFIFYLYLFLFTRRKTSEAVLSEEPSTVICLIRKNVFDFNYTSLIKAFQVFCYFYILKQNKQL